MLGKRFRRTTSMSYIGPKAPLPAGGGLEQQASSAGGRPAFFLPNQASNPTTSICSKSPRPLHVDVQHQWHSAAEKTLPDEAMPTGMDVHMSSHVPVPHLIHEDPDVHAPYPVETEPVGPNLQGLGCNENLKIGQYIPTHVLAAHESIWGQYMASVPVQIHRIEAEESISPVDFLDVCFFCKRRLRHERDIFIYRGDTAFCSEECRHRQIVNDERRSKKGTPATTETAVAA